MWKRAKVSTTSELLSIMRWKVESEQPVNPCDKRYIGALKTHHRCKWIAPMVQLPSHLWCKLIAPMVLFLGSQTHAKSDSRPKVLCHKFSTNPCPLVSNAYSMALYLYKNHSYSYWIWVHSFFFDEIFLFVI